ncbi:replication initiation and membrane attachment protein DnaB [Furfurilactobacillus siliginis]|nr:replication initiation and membrane attachment protein DnaB [Furfurilactobacillus siliginis]
MISMFPQHVAFADEAWRLLYQPILGGDAFSIYSALESFASAHPQLSQRQQHSLLLGWLGIDVQHFVTGRRRLEAVGLVETYYQSDSVGEVFVYKLRLPLEANAFLADDLLSVLLLQTVGQERYDALVAHFEQPEMDLTALTNVSADFLSVYRVSNHQLAQRPAEIADVASTGARSEATVIDFKLVANYLKAEYVDLASVMAEQSLLDAEAQLYGFTERELATLIVKATSVTTNKFAVNRFKSLAAEQFHAQQPALTVTEADAPAAAVTPTDDNQLNALVAAVKSYAPADFLATLKQEKNQYVTDEEQRILAKFMARKVFAPSVVNMLIYYLINDRDQNVLYQNSLDRVANDWSKAKVATPEQAVTHMRDYAQAQAERQRQRQTKQPAKSREQLPDWNEAPASEASVDDSNRIAELRRQLDDAKQNRKEES